MPGTAPIFKKTFTLSVSVNYYRKKDSIYGKSIGAPIYSHIYARCDNRRREPILFRGFFFLFGANGRFGLGRFDAPLVLPRYKIDESFPCTSLLTETEIACLNDDSKIKKINIPKSPVPQNNNKAQPSSRCIFLLYTIFNRT